MSARRYTLENGLKVIVEASRNAPVAAVQVWINAGSADEREDQAGLAHLHEHMLFKGTKRRGAGQVARDIEASGGEINAWTSFDQTVYHTVSAVDELDTSLDVLSDVVCEPSFEHAELAREIEVIVEEIKRAFDSPARRLSRALFENVYRRHPYRRPVLGTIDSVRSFTRDSVLEFFENFYRPENATVVVVGDREEEELFERVAEHFSGWQGKGTLKRPDRPRETFRPQLRLVPVAHPVKEARASIAWPIPAIQHPDVAALDLLSVVLGHGDSSRLAVETLRKQQLVNGAGAYAYTPKDPGVFVMTATMRSESAETALLSMFEQVHRLQTQKLESDELEKARVVMLSESAYQRETVQGLARKLGFYETVCGDFAFEQKYEAALRELDAEDVRDAAQRYLSAPPTIVVLDEKPATAGLSRVFESEPEPAPAVPSSIRSGPDGVVRVELESGAKILVLPENSPVVAYRAVALGGLRWENESLNGLSYLLTACWAKAIEGMNQEELAARAASLGGALTAFSGRNTLGLRGEFIRDRWRQGLDLGIDATIASVLDASELDRERALALERIHNRADNPAGMAFDAFLDALFPRHPYGRRLVGTEENVSRFAITDLIGWRDLVLDPRRLVFAVVGDVDAHVVVRVLEEALGGERPSSLPIPFAADAPPEGLVRRRLHTDKAQCHVVVGAMGTTVEDPARDALQVLTTVLAGQGGRLFRDLRDEASLAYSVSSSNVEGLDPGHVLTYGATSPDKVNQMVEGLHRHLDALLEKPIDDAELARAKRYLAGTHAIDLQRAGARAMVMALGEAFGLGYDHYRSYPERIRAISAADVQEAARRFLPRERRVEVVVGP